MLNIHRRLLDAGLCIPEISLPEGSDLEKWAVIACDQFTQDRQYWEKVKNTIAGAPSTLDLILPEVFLSGGDKAERINHIHEAMNSFLDTAILAPSRRGCIYLERDTPFHQRRRGLVAAIDLEQYEWDPSARPLIRSTEGTVAERLPPRMDIRRGAPLETPHILLLIDDDTDSLLPALGERAKRKAPVYQTGLMMDSGSVRGWFLDDEADWAFMAEQFGELARRSVTRYGPGGKPFLFAVGDGNHSLATAKAVWEEYKDSHKSAAPGGLPDHPCRYALVEIENIYDPAIQFEPIHRVVFGASLDTITALLSELPLFHRRELSGREELVRLTAEACGGNRFGLVSGNSYALIETGAAGISTAGLQPLLDSRSLSIDYIHGAEELFRLAGGDAVGILLPPVQKAGLFETVARSGPLPRKSFSMGESCEKRFYLECRKLFG